MSFITFFLLAQASSETDPGVLDAWFQWVSGSTASSISFALNIVMFVLAIGGFYLYIVQKREYRILFAMVEEFGVKEKLERAKTQVAEEHEKMQETLESTQKDVQTAQKELAERLPIEARRAYYENAIPAVAQQISDLKYQLDRMQGELIALGDGQEIQSPYLRGILSEEMEKHMAIRREMEKAQLLLSIFTGSAAAAGLLVPYPFNLISIPLAIGIVRQCLILLRLWRTYYSSKSKDVS